MAHQTEPSGQLQIFEYEKQARIRSLNIDGEIWWVANDVCAVLGIKNVGDAVSRLDDDEKRNDIALTDSIGRRQFGLIVNEPGLYTLILRSGKPEAKKFKRWITHDVLPQIRKTGAYGLRAPGVPAFVRRFNDNWDRVDSGYFSIISELFIRVYGKLEQIGYIIPDKSKRGKEIRPDVSVGKLFPKWLEARHPELKDAFKYYTHVFPDGFEVEARQYPNIVLPEFIEFVERAWIPKHAEGYFRERDPKALSYLPKLLGESETPKPKLLK